MFAALLHEHTFRTRIGLVQTPQQRGTQTGGVCEVRLCQQYIEPWTVRVTASTIISGKTKPSLGIVFGFMRALAGCVEDPEEAIIFTPNRQELFLIAHCANHSLLFRGT